MADDVRCNDHNNYDVAEIFALGWPHMVQSLKAQARGALSEMLRWSLADSVAVRRFQDGPPLDAFYFGIRFLERVGYWDERRRFWWTGPLPTPDGVPDLGSLARSLLVAFDALDDASERGDKVDPQGGGRPGRPPAIS